MSWPWTSRSRAGGRQDRREAVAAVAQAHGRDADVARLGRELTEIQRANHFSAMVQAALSRSREA